MTTKQNVLVNKDLRFNLSQSEKTISARAYNLIIGGCLLYGFVVNALMISTLTDFFTNMNTWTLLIGYIVCVIIGVALTRSDSALVSFVGYNFIVVPLGALLTVLLPYYASDMVFDAVLITGGITLLMMIFASIYPNMFLKMGRTLFFLLISVFLVELVAVFIFQKDFAAFDYAVVAIFSGYIGYDWAKANVYPKTVNNAVDSATDLYMDIINIFVRVLAILERNN